MVGLWDDVNSAGVLFKLRIEQVDGVTPGCIFTNCDRYSFEYVVPKVLLIYTVLLILEKQHIKTSAYNGKIQNHVIKYDGRLTGNPAIVDIKVLRLEEVYLNMAEAQYRINGGGLAFLDAQRYAPFVSGGETGAALLSAILRERIRVCF
jgi:hypothetical protein